MFFSEKETNLVEILIVIQFKLDKRWRVERTRKKERGEKERERERREKERKKERKKEREKQGKRKRREREANCAFSSSCF